MRNIFRVFDSTRGISNPLEDSRSRVTNLFIFHGGDEGFFPYGNGTPRRFRKAETSAGSSNPLAKAKQFAFFANTKTT